ncbi:M20 family metallopeptidase [Cohnella lubricantis]|uniref:M20 family metallopeptidase n=1 Tax=Cohnella lubricantis TaxID=2163172 RepID=A0A841TCY2_9BACL|nr:M20 family metallopeptidase [Cohnella lubricantis]MBB6678882.1 M20 family metallopeptidase [Cohnella lubricantis]MBP2120207.1 glutamate carboxypeptidase [Cohnella lubricantis]
MTDIYQLIQSYMPELLKLLEESVNMDSPSSDKTHTDRMADWYAFQFERIVGGRVSRQPNREYGDRLLCEAGEGERRVLLLGHLDTVWPAGEAERRPFTIRGGRAYGPGVYDMKAGLLQAMFALKALKEAGRFPADKTVAVFINSDEEISSVTSRAAIEEEAGSASAVLVLEPPMEPNGALKTARKGSGRYKLVIEGVSAHAGVDPSKGVSAIHELSYQIQALQALNNFETGTSVNVGIIHGGIASNVVAGSAEAEIDVRVATKEEAERIHEAVMGLKPKLPFAKLTISGGMLRPPMVRTEEAGRLYRLARQIAQDELNLNLPEAATGGVSDGNFTAALGIPTLDGLGARGDFAHSPKEYVELEEIPRRTLLLARLIERC